MFHMEQIQCAHSELADPDSLVEHPQNPNKHPEKQIKMLSKILSFQGQRIPILVSKRSGFIVAGHGRLQAIKMLGWEKCAVDYQDFENEAQEYAHMIADNKIAEMAQNDDEAMFKGIAELDIEDLDLYGIDKLDLDSLEEPDLPELKEGDNDIKAVTFKLSNDQSDQLDDALAKAKKMGPLEDAINDNQNGNALARIAEWFITNA